MESSLEEQCSALGSVFQQIIADMKNGAPLWEDLIVKALKLHSCLRTVISAVAGYLDAFQKIADAATNARGATKELGSALTRICLRHRAVESRMKTLTSTIMDRLISPLQEKLDEWKKTVINLDKEHAKESKKARSELKKRSTDTLRLQKKARKGKSGELQVQMASSLADVTECRGYLEQTESRAVRAALIEHRSRFCLLVDCFQPVVDEEVGLLGEMGHIQEAAEQLAASAAEPTALPAACEELIETWMAADRQGGCGISLRTPPSSPSSLGSRKSSMASISSLSSSSSSAKWQTSVSQLSELCVGESKDDQPTNAGPGNPEKQLPHPGSTWPHPPEKSAIPLTSTWPHPEKPPMPPPGSTWPNVQDKLQFERAATAILNDRPHPHTISSVYERGHQRTPLSVMTFHAPQSQPSSPGGHSVNANQSQYAAISPPQYASVTPTIPQSGRPQPPAPPPRPPIPQRNSSLAQPPSPKPIPPRCTETQGVYVNMSELAWLAASKAQEMTANLPPPPPELADCSTSESSLESSSGYGSQTQPPEEPPPPEAGRKLMGNGKKPPPPIRRTASISCHSVDSREQLPPPPAFLLENDSNKDSTRVADTVRALTALHHTPASPNAPRKVSCARSISLERRETVISTLTSRLSHPLSPRHLRRHSEGVGRAGQKLLESLNARLALQQAALGHPHVQHRVADPAILRASLMEEIKQGTHLRKTAAVNDRSAPKIY